MGGDHKPFHAINKWLWPSMGALLLLIGVGTAAVVEKGLIDYRVQMRRHGGSVVDLGSDGQPVAGRQGYMARVVGPVQVVEAPLDTTFNQRSDQPVLIRHVEMFQWHELRYGSSPTYELDWQDHPIDSSQFQHPDGHANPGKFPIEAARFDAGMVRVNGFVLDPALVHALTGSQPFQPDMHSLPANLAASFTEHDGALVTSAVPSHPRVGDLRVSWESVPAQTVTVVARVNGNKLDPAQDAPDGIGFVVQPGNVSLSGLFPDSPLPPEDPWAGRIFAWVLAVLGMALLLRWHYRRIDGVLAPAVAFLVIGAVDGLLWLGHGRLQTAGWFGLALICVMLTTWRMHALRLR